MRAGGIKKLFGGLSVLAALWSAGAFGAGASSNPSRGGSEQAAREWTVAEWLLLGPVASPWPALHEEKPGRVDLEKLLEEERWPRRWLPPVEGESVGGFGPQPLRWRRAAATDGQLSLELPAAVPPDAPAEVWLATYVGVSAWSAFELRLFGTHPRRVWLDGQPLAQASAASEGDDPKVAAKLELTPGKHWLLVRSLRDPERASPWTLRAVLRETKAPAGEPRFSLDRVRPLTIEDIVDAPSVAALSLAPDGSAVALVVRETPPGAGQAETRVEVRRTSDGRLEWTWRGVEIEQVAWAPAGRRLAYVTRDRLKKDADGERKPKGEVSTIWLADLETGEVRPLVEGVRNLGGYRWVPGGGAVVYSAARDPESDETGLRRVESLLDRQADRRRTRHLWLVSVPEGVRRRLTAGAASTEIQDIASDGRRMLFTRQLDDYEARPYTRTELWELDLQTLAVRKLHDGRWLVRARYAPDGKRLLVQAGPSEFGSSGIAVPEGQMPNEYDHQLFLWDPATGGAESLTLAFDPAVRDFALSERQRAIYLRAEEGDRVPLYRLDLEARRFERLEVGLDVLEALELPPSSPLAVVTGSGPWLPEAVAVVDLGRRDARILHRPAERWLAAVARGRVEDWSFTARSGRTIHGRVYLPPDFDPARRYPCIVYYYGGTSPTSRSFGGRYPKEYWASLGYVVYVLQPSGATGYGQAFSALHVNDWGESPAEEILEGVARFLETHPYVDPARLGAIGASFGGFLTMRLLTKTDRFAAAVSHAGIALIPSYWGEGYWGYAYSAIAAAESFPWSRPDVFLERSPLMRADRVRTPLLLLHGTADTNVPVGESDAFFTALKLLGAPVEYVQVPGEDHWIVDRDKRLRWSRTIAAWFERWLKGRPEWWEALYPERE